MEEILDFEEKLPTLEYSFIAHSDHWFRYIWASKHADLGIFLSTAERLLPECIHRDRSGYTTETINLLVDHANFLHSYVPPPLSDFKCTNNEYLCRWYTLLKHIERHMYDPTGSRFGFLMLMSRIVWPIAFAEAC